MIEPREDQDIRAYVRALEERVMKLEARLARKDNANLRAKGYMQMGPGGHAEQIDAKACKESACPNCGRVGLRYEPWMRGHPKSYIAFACCPKCGNREEF